MFRFLHSKNAASPRCLAIIGNGFDIAHGMKTSYSDFINAQSLEVFLNTSLFSKKTAELRMVGIHLKNELMI